MNAVEFKRYFKKHFGIAVRVQSSPSKRYVTLLIQRKHAGVRLFPQELGNLCLKVIYGADSSTGQQNWAGNVASHMIAMSPAEWEKVIATLDAERAVTELVV